MRIFASIRLSSVVLVAGVLTVAVRERCCEVRAQDNAQATKSRASVEGAWKQAGQIDRSTEKLTTLPEGIEQVKLITGGRFNWTVTQDGKLLASAGGSYTIKDGVYTEKVTFVASDSHKHLLGKSFAYPIRFEDGKWHLKATFKLDDGEMAIDELWQRCP
jgi:hypothetical protein